MKPLQNHCHIPSGKHERERERVREGNKHTGERGVDERGKEMEKPRTDA